MSSRLFVSLSIVLLAAPLVACGGDDAGPGASGTDMASTSSTTIATATGGAVTSEATDAPASTAAPTTISPTTTTTTATTTTTTTATTTTTTTTAEPLPDTIDPCLVGTWEMRSQQFFDDLVASSPAGSFEGSVQHESGRQFISMSADGAMFGGRDQWAFRTTSPNGDAIVTLDGLDEGTWSVDGDELTFSQTEVGEVDVTVEVEIGGVRQPFPVPGGSTFPGQETQVASGTYTCDGGTFTLTRTEDGITLTIVWDQVAG